MRRGMGAAAAFATVLSLDGPLPLRKTTVTAGRLSVLNNAVGPQQCESATTSVVISAVHNRGEGTHRHAAKTVAPC